MLHPTYARFFQENRFLRVEKVIPHELVQAARRQLEDDCAAAVEPLKRNSDGSIEKLYGLFARGGAYLDVIRFPHLLDILCALIGPDIVFTLNRHNQGGLNKAPGKMRLHRDVLRQGHISVIAYLDDSTTENGATLIVPGSHKLPYCHEKHGGMWLDSGEYEYSLLGTQAIPVPVHSGGVLIFDSALFHSVGENRSGEPRAALVLGYEPVNELTGVVSPFQHLVCGRNLYRGNASLR